jgi:hypothetical protein
MVEKIFIIIFFLLKILILASAGFTKSEENNTNNRLISASLKTYIDYFEKQFLQETEQFYQLESKDYMEKNSTNDYIKKVILEIPFFCFE